MNRDIPTIRVEDAVFINKAYAPYSLQLNTITYNKIYKWIANRALPLSRKNAEKIYRTVGLPRDNTEFEMLCMTHGVSINDNFWIADDSEIGKLSYKNINIFTNSLNESLYLVALKGDTRFTITDTNISGEYTGQGTYPKCFVRESDGIYMYKAGSNSDITREIYAAFIGKLLGMKTVDYEYRTLSGVNCSVSKIATNLDTSWESAFIVSEKISEKYNTIPQEYAMQYFSLDYSNMVIFDAIILNDDRHMKNWSFEFGENTSEIRALAISYDYNKAFEADIKSKSNLVFDGQKRMNVLSAGRAVYREIGTTLNLQYLYNAIDEIDFNTSIVNKQALKNRILYIIGEKDNQRDCY
jgi:hypothetical protein